MHPDSIFDFGAIQTAYPLACLFLYLFTHLLTCYLFNRLLAFLLTYLFIFVRTDLFTSTCLLTILSTSGWEAAGRPRTHSRETEPEVDSDGREQKPETDNDQEPKPEVDSDGQRTTPKLQLRGQSSTAHRSLDPERK